ncbi:MAG: SPOR domain-containing protein [Halocynthiibacter sp.]
MARRSIFHLSALGALLLGASACNLTEGFSLKKPTKAQETETSGEMVEQDVEAPQVFQQTEKGLWDGRPSLGGVWVAHPDVKDPERVIIRKKGTDKFVIGALFRRERESVGPRIQISSDAATALDILAGQPTTLNVTALRREKVAVPSKEKVTLKDGMGAKDDIKATALEDPKDIAAAAIAKSEKSKGKAKAAPKATKASSLTKPYVQLGIFSVKSNANDTAAKSKKAGLNASVKETTSKGKTFWRVIVGPATNSASRAEMHKKVKSIGFADAYFVKG